MTGYRSAQGFTLVELMMTVLIAAILLAIAVPGFQQLLASNRAQAQAGLLYRSFNYARSEAIRRSMVVVIAPMSGTDWVQGWRIWADKNDNGTLDSGEDELQVQGALTGSPTITTSATLIKFLASGAMNDSSSTQYLTNENTFLFATPSSGSYCIKVAHAGRVSSMKKTSCP